MFLTQKIECTNPKADMMFESTVYWLKVLVILVVLYVFKSLKMSHLSAQIVNEAFK